MITSDGIISSERALVLRLADQGLARRVASRRHQDQAFALARIGKRHHRRLRRRPKLGHERLDGRERDHLAADLGETLGTAADRDEALLVDSDDVAGVVPAFRRRLDHAGVGGA